MQNQKKVVRVQSLNSAKVLNFVIRTSMSLKQVREELKKLQIDIDNYTFMTIDRKPIQKNSESLIALSAILAFGSIFYIEQDNLPQQQNMDVQIQKKNSHRMKTYKQFEDKIKQLKIKLQQFSTYFINKISTVSAVDQNYKGQINQFGLYDGIGRFRHFNKEVYNGEFKNGHKNGLGMYTFANGNRYQGQFANGQAQGLGIQYLVSGESTAAVYKNNLPHGLGIRYFVNGQRLQCEFVKGKIQGQAVRIFPDGAQVTQNYINGVPSLEE